MAIDGGLAIDVGTDYRWETNVRPVYMSPRTGRSRTKSTTNAMFQMISERHNPT
jgi:hypothetical protein